MEIAIAPELLERIVAHCRSEYPREACGLLAVDAGRVVAFWPGTNVLHSPVNFRMADEEVAQLLWEIEEVRGLEAAPYHSHPRGPARLSATDLAYPGYRIQLLVSLADRQRPEVRVFQVEDGRVEELSVTGPASSDPGAGLL